VWVVIAVYLLHGAHVPTLDHRVYPDKAKCQDVAKRFVEQVRAGQARAFCLKVKT
jgi:hypothetical protein